MKIFAAWAVAVVRACIAVGSAGLPADIPRMVKHPHKALDFDKDREALVAECVQDNWDSYHLLLLEGSLVKARQSVHTGCN